MKLLSSLIISFLYLYTICFTSIRFPTIKRVVTGHTNDSTAIFANDNEYETVVILSGDAAMVTTWAIASEPADLNDKTDDINKDTDTTLNGGSLIQVVDMLPYASSPRHCTSSIDYTV